jgi:hypothetical protein
MQIPSMLHGQPTAEPRHEKKCQYPGCNEIYVGTGIAKYCVEHRQRKYRKVINVIGKKLVIKENPNIIYKHTHYQATEIKFVCPLCGAEFMIKVFPNIDVYPRFCADHMNEFKRNKYRMQHGIKTIEELVIKPIVGEDVDDFEFDEDMVENIGELL